MKFTKYFYILIISSFLLPTVGQAFDREEMKQAHEAFKNCLQEKGIELPSRGERKRGERPARPQLTDAQKQSMDECRELAGLPEHRGQRPHGPPPGAENIEQSSN